jgi:hypothetical protein
MAATGKYDAFCDCRVAGESDLEKWASDPNCNQQKECLAELYSRRGRAITDQIPDQKLQIEKDRDWLLAHPFDPRNEVSADAKRIIRHLWILLFVIPLVAGLILVVIRDIN